MNARQKPDTFLASLFAGSNHMKSIQVLHFMKIFLARLARCFSPNLVLNPNACGPKETFSNRAKLQLRKAMRWEGTAHSSQTLQLCCRLCACNAHATPTKSQKLMDFMELILNPSILFNVHQTLSKSLLTLQIAW